MEGVLTVPIADNIISPVGFTTEENVAAVEELRSGLRSCSGRCGLPFDFTASLLDRDRFAEACAEENIGDDYTFFEKMLILSVTRAMSGTGVDPASPRTLFVISTTKGNVSLLENPGVFPESRLPLSRAAWEVACRRFGCPNPPLVVSNACISGLCACLAAHRSLQSGRYSHVIVAGADEQSPFIVSGFQSFMAVSPEECRPFDKDRRGLNPGEAAAALVFEARDSAEAVPGQWAAVRGAVRNDANHISAPSRTGDGCRQALKYALGDFPPQKLAFLSLHGTATDYNDSMEGEAVAGAGLLDIPVVGFKGYYGHTMGAAGVLETILSMKAVDRGTVPATRGFSTLGVRVPLSVSSSSRKTDRTVFIKALSGFGGCNAAMLFQKM